MLIMDFSCSRVIVVLAQSLSTEVNASLSVSPPSDIAVGAPYGGPDGMGAVFIYHGFGLRSGDTRDTDKEKPAQVRELVRKAREY